MGLQLKTPATNTPISLSEAKDHCRITDNTHDSVISGYIEAATNFLEEEYSIAIITQTWLLHLDRFTDNIQFPISPVQDVKSVKYFDTSGTLQTLDANNYALDIVSEVQWLVRTSTGVWPLTATGINNVIIEFTVGKTEAPSGIKQALLLLVGHWFSNREASSNTISGTLNELPFAVKSLMRRYEKVILA